MNMFRRILKYLLITLAAGAVIVALLLILLQTSWLRGVLQDAALDALNTSIQGELTADVVEGNLFSGVELHNAALSLGGNEIISIPSLRIEYDILDLFEQRINVRILEVDSVIVYLLRDRDSIWNIVKALAPRQQIETPSDEGGPFAWRVVVDTLRIRNFRADVVSGERRISVRDFAFLGSGLYCADSLSVRGAAMSFVVSDPEMRVRECTFLFHMDSSQIVLNNFVLKTRDNQLSGEGRYAMDQDTFIFDLFTGPLHPVEFESLFGELPLKGHPILRVNGTFAQGELRSSVDLHEGEKGLSADLQYDTAPEIPRYSVTGSLQELEVGHLIDEDLTVSPLNGHFSIEGTGATPGEMNVRSSISLRNFSINEIGLGYVDASVVLHGDSAWADVRSVGPSGTLSLSSNLADLSASRSFSVEGTVNNLDSSPASGIRTDVSGTFSLHGALSGPGGPAFSLIARADSSMVDTVFFDSITCGVRFADGVMQVDSLRVQSAGTVAFVRGVADTSGAFDARFLFRMDDLAPLARFSDGDSIGGRALVTGSISGIMNNVSAEVSVEVTDLILNGKDIGNLSGHTTANMLSDSTVVVIAESLILAWNQTEWKNQDTLTLLIFADGFDLKPLTLFAGEQTIALGGSIHGERYSDVSLTIDRFDIRQVALSLFGLNTTGVLDLSLRLQGTRDHPQLESAVLFEQGTHNGLDLPRVQFHAGAVDSLLTWDVNLETRAGTLEGEGAFPLQIPDTNTSEYIAHDRPIRATLKTEQFDLSLLRILETSPVVVTGFLNGNLNIGGTMKSPEVEGFIGIDSGAVAHPGLGIDYQGIRVRLSGNKEALLVEEFSVADGAVTGSGSIGFTVQDSLTIEPDLVFKATNFEVLAGPTHFATINGDVRVDNDERGNIRFDGEIVLNRSRLYLPALQSIQTTRDLDPPFLLIAAGRVDTSSRVLPDSARAGPRLPSFTGKISLKIPRATWLRGPRMNVELSGNIDVSSEAGTMIVSGFLVVEQGTYEFYGRKFVFNQGRVDFEGGEELDPSIYFEVEYPFRTDGVENSLMIIVRGRSRSPVIEFFFNKDAISESDAISYIVFGRKVDDLNYGQKSTVTDLGNALAMDLAANMVNTQLSSMVGSTLGLDVVRVSGEDNWNKAVLTAGKYVTDEVFVAYERGISQSGSSSVVFESATLEYYLTKFLYLHLIEATDYTSGFDVFLKFE